MKKEGGGRGWEEKYRRERNGEQLSREKGIFFSILLLCFFFFRSLSSPRLGKTVVRRVSCGKETSGRRTREREREREAAEKGFLLDAQLLPISTAGRRLRAPWGHFSSVSLRLADK